MRIPLVLREPIRKEEILHVGVRRVEDPHHPSGLRELRSPAETRKLVNRKLVELGRICCDLTYWMQRLYRRCTRPWKSQGNGSRMARRSSK